jgi:carboxymethylenebutenolidase
MLPDARGLSPFYRDLAVLFAETGTAALAIDYFGRPAGCQARSGDSTPGRTLRSFAAAPA